MATVKQIKRDLGDLGVEYPKNAKKSELEALLEVSERRFDDAVDAMVEPVTFQDEEPNDPAVCEFCCGAEPVGSLRCGECGRMRIEPGDGGFIDPNWGNE